LSRSLGGNMCQRWQRQFFHCRFVSETLLLRAHA
jgi:hypothetical protein